MFASFSNVFTIASAAKDEEGHKATALNLLTTTGNWLKAVDEMKPIAEQTLDLINTSEDLMAADDRFDKLGDSLENKLSDEGAVPSVKEMVSAKKALEGKEAWLHCHAL